MSRITTQQDNYKLST